MIDVDEDVLGLSKKAEHFYNSVKAVHVKFKKGYWKNGYIKEVSADFFILDEFLDGEIPCFFFQIEDIEVYTIDNFKRVKDGTN